MSTEVRRHERRKPSGGTATVRRHARKTPWSPGQVDEVTAAVGAFSFSVVMVLIWALTAVMSLTAAVLSVVSALALAVLGHKVHKRRKAKRTHASAANQLKTKRRRNRAVLRHPLVHLRKSVIQRIKRFLGRAETTLAGKANPRRTK